MDSVSSLRATATVRRSVQRLSRRLRAERPPDGMPVTSLSILAGLMDDGPQTSGSLARALRTTPQALTRSIEALRRDEMLVRDVDPADNRQYLLTITDKGYAALATDAAPRDLWLERAMHDLLTAQERDILVVAAALLGRLARYEPPPPDRATEHALLTPAVPS